MKKRQKKIVFIVGSLLLTALVGVLSLSLIAKWFIQKYDVQITGREIYVDWVYVNPITGFAYMHNLVIHEYESDSVFLKADGLSANITMYKLFARSYDITSLTLNRPTGFVIQKELVFNFLDLIEKFKADEDEKPREEQVKFNLQNIKIINGTFHYTEDQTPVAYFIKNVHIKSTGYRYDVDTMAIDFAFSSGPSSGEVIGNLTIDLANQNYKLNVAIDTFDLAVVNQYLQDLTNYGSVSAMLDADIKTTGNFGSTDSISTRGNIAISNFKFKQDDKDDLASFKKLVIAIHHLSPKDMIYHYDSVILTQPFAKYQLYDYLDNVQAIFGEGGDKVTAANADPNKFNLIIEVAKLIDNISRNFLSSQYKIGKFAVYDGNFQFADYSLGEKFHIGFSPFNLVADSIDKSQNRVQLDVKSGIMPYGELFVSLSIDPQDSSYFDLNYGFQKIPLSMFNPYFTSFTSYPLDRGTLELLGKWRVRAAKIESSNHLIILDPRIAKKVKSKDNGNILLPLAMAFVRERGNVIDYEIPITGDLNNPKFNLWDVVFDILKNMFVKPVTTPYRMEVKNVERELEKSMFIKWEHQKSTLNSGQEKIIGQMVKFLKENPEAKINIQPNSFELKEKEYILLFEAKKKYFLTHHQTEGKSFTPDDSVMVERMSIKDEGLVKYLNALAKDSTLHTAQAKAAIIVDQADINTKYNNLLEARERAFLELFSAKEIEKQVVFLKNKNTIPFNGFSFFEISYKGDLPNYLKEAYFKMDELNREAPREMYHAKREKNTSEK